MIDELQNSIKHIEGMGAKFVTARFDEFNLRTLIRENGKVTESKATLRTGVGFTALYDGATGYAFTADLAKDAMNNAAENALGIAKASSKAAGIKIDYEPATTIDKVKLTPDIQKRPWELSTAERMEYLTRMEGTAKEHGEKISSLVTRWGDYTGKKIVTNSEGLEVEWVPYIAQLSISVTSKAQDGTLANSGAGQGGSVGMEFFETKENNPELYGEQAGTWAKEQMVAKAAPVGEHRALVDNILAGVLAHETFGHCCEADFIMTKFSVFAGKLGEKLGTDIVTIYDDGTPENNDISSGLYLPFDDEGIKTTKTLLMENGVLKAFLNDRGSNSFTKTGLSGNGRAVNFTFPAIPRMKNTYFSPGDMTEEEAISELGTGVYGIGTTGGQANPGDGSFLFKARRGYFIENGEKKYPIKDVTITGNMIDFLGNVEGLTKDFKLQSGYFGGCGKGGQFPLPCGLGGPQMLLTSARFGGRT